MINEKIDEIKGELAGEEGIEINEIEKIGKLCQKNRRPETWN